ncbi:hypothetical protein [Streptomyces sp. NPDC088915]|uniref:hypothetical protein n=1 Tax=Streptomyces sp. NPDC088915 TaxID=3365912 RepID=UPI0037F1C77A
MSLPGIARVTETDIEAAAAFREKLDERPTGFADLLFDPPAHGPTAWLNPNDQAAVGVTLTYRHPGAPDQDRLLPVLHAVGRCHSYGVRQLMQVGTVMLGGEIAARYLYQQLARRYPPFFLKPLKTVIALQWPLPEEGRPDGPQHPAMALLRLANGPDRGLFTVTEIQAMRLVARTLPGGGDQEQRLRCAAQICSTFARGHIRFRREDLAAVREEVLTARTADQLNPTLETL